MKRTMITLAVSLAAIIVWGQDDYTDVLQQIEQNSTTLRALQEQMNAQQLENRSGLLPSDPEVEFGYLWGSPVAIGDRKDVSIKQTFDFPGVYANKSKLSRLQNESAEYEYKSERMALLLSAKESCIELTYYNALHKLCEQRLANARQIAQAAETMSRAGEMNRIEYNKAMLNLTNMSNEVRQVEVERERLLSQLMRMNGGKPLVFDAASYRTTTLPADFESWYAEAEAANASLQYLKSEVVVADRQVKLSRASSLPKFSIGYMGEFVEGERFQGVTMGISIPLWENKNRTKQAKAAAIASQMVVEDAKTAYYTHLKQLYLQAATLQENVRQYRAVLQENNNGELLLKAYEHGEITLLDYLLEMEYLFTATDSLLQAERDLALALASLNAYQL